MLAFAKTPQTGVAAWSSSSGCTGTPAAATAHTQLFLTAGSPLPESSSCRPNPMMPWTPWPPANSPRDHPPQMPSASGTCLSPRQRTLDMPSITKTKNKNKNGNGSLPVRLSGHTRRPGTRPVAWPFGPDEHRLLRTSVTSPPSRPATNRNGGRARRPLLPSPTLVQPHRPTVREPIHPDAPR